MAPSVPPGSPVFRCASAGEDHLLSRILCNAFLPLWNHNYFHGIQSPLDPVPLTDGKDSAPLTPAQQSRVHFYYSLIQLTRQVGGEVLVACTVDEHNPKTEALRISAVLLWEGPHKRLSSSLLRALPVLYRSGFVSLLLPWHYGLRGLYRVQGIFEANVARMFADTLPSLGFSAGGAECAFVQMLARNPACDGRGHASRLLEWRIRRHVEEQERCAKRHAVILDTTTLQGIRTYERLGFRLLASTAVVTGTDARGIPLEPDAGTEIKKAAAETCVQRVMIRL